MPALRQAVSVKPPIIQLDDAPLAEDDTSYPDEQQQLPLDDVPMGEAIAHDQISRGVFDEGEGFYSEDELDEDDPEDWTRMTLEEMEENVLVLDKIRETFEDDVDLFDTTMVAEYSDEIFAYMEELEVRARPPVHIMRLSSRFLIRPVCSFRLTRWRTRDTWTLRRRLSGQSWRLVTQTLGAFLVDSLHNFTSFHLSGACARRLSTGFSRSTFVTTSFRRPFGLPSTSSTASSPSASSRLSSSNSSESRPCLSLLSTRRSSRRGKPLLYYACGPPSPSLTYCSYYQR